jgi:hypothetical protein
LCELLELVEIGWFLPLWPVFSGTRELVSSPCENLLDSALHSPLLDEVKDNRNEPEDPSEQGNDENDPKGDRWSVIDIRHQQETIVNVANLNGSRIAPVDGTERRLDGFYDEAITLSLHTSGYFSELLLQPHEYILSRGPCSEPFTDFKLHGSVPIPIACMDSLLAILCR